MPLASVASVTRSLEFYASLGFQATNTHTPEGGDAPVWAWLQSGGAHLMLSTAEAPVDGQAAVLFYLYVEDVEAFRQHLKESGIEAGPITYPFWAPRGEFRVEDPDGYVLMITHT